ncbi:MAG: pyridoxal phosphate-dependent aminotransferase [Bdellovibrionia bacterium]
MLSKRVQNLKTSPTLALVAKAKELAAHGHDVISLTVGEPDWPTFSKASSAGIKAIESGNTKYTPAQGTVELRKAIALKTEKLLGVPYAVNQVTVASGAKFIVFAALQVLCDVGDEVIISAPYWVSYPTMIELADAKPVIVDCGAETQFKLTAEMLEKAITPKTKIFLFCSPSNPTGIIYTRDELKAIADVLRRHPQVHVISDDMYNLLMFGKMTVAPHLLHVAPDLIERVIAVNGGSKAYSMTGWRIGWGVGSAKIIKAMSDYQSQAIGSPSSIAQAAVKVALEECDVDLEGVNKKLLERKQICIDELQQVAGFKVYEPQGAFYLWVDIKAHLGKSYQGQKVLNSKDFCDILLDKFYVATVPGIECGTEGYMRLSFATEVTLFKKAVVRMKDFISQLS